MLLPNNFYFEFVPIDPNGTLYQRVINNKYKATTNAKDASKVGTMEYLVQRMNFKGKYGREEFIVDNLENTTATIPEEGHYSSSGEEEQEQEIPSETGGGGAQLALFVYKIQPRTNRLWNVSMSNDNRKLIFE